MATLTTFPVDTKPLASEPVAFPKRDATLFGVKQANGAVEQYALSEITNTYDLRQFGVRGDTPTIDYSTEVAACFTAAPAGSVIEFPQGGTVLMRSYVSPTNDRLTIHGNGCKIISDGAGQDRKFNVVGRTGIKFDNLFFDGFGLTTHALPTAFDSYTPRETPGTIHFSDSVNCKVTDCDFKGLNWPITLLGACSDFKIHDNSFAGYMTGVYGYLSGYTGSNGPKFINVSDNHFEPGKYPVWILNPPETGRQYPPVPYHCTGAIKFRAGHDVDFFGSKPCAISGNTITASGMMGIEVQGGLNDTVIFGNTVASVDNGISLSYMQRCIVATNTIRDCNYTHIECDGRGYTADDLTKESNSQIMISGNIIYSADVYGRPVNFVNNVGIVVSNLNRNLVISGGSIKYCKTGIAILQKSSSVNISTVDIVTNFETGGGGWGSYQDGVIPWVQGILVNDSSKVDIDNCTIAQTGYGKQRLINVWESTGVRIKNCTLTTNESGYYIKDSTDVHVDGGSIKDGPGVDGYGTSSFVTIDSTGASCTNISLRGIKLNGTFADGIKFYAPANIIDQVLIDGCDTRQAFAVASGSDGFNFLNLLSSGSGTIGRLDIRENPGAGDDDPQRNISVPVLVKSGSYIDTPAFDTIVAQFNTTVDLQTAVGYNGKKKRIILKTVYSRVTIHPKSGETINESTADVLIDGQYGSVELFSDGHNWILVRIPRMVGLQNISSAVFTHDFGTINPGEQAYVNVTIDCRTGATNTPSVSIGWSGNLPIGVVEKNAFVSGENQGTLIIHNTSGSAAGVGSMQFRFTVFEYGTNS